VCLNENYEHNRPTITRRRPGSCLPFTASETGAALKIWLPYIIGGSGTDTFTETLATALQEAGHEAVVQSFPHIMQFCPGVLRSVKMPEATDIVFTNSWAGFAFKRRGVAMVTMEQLFVHDPAYASFRSKGQAVFHSTLVHWFEKRTFHDADRVVAVSRATQKAVMDAFPDVDPIVIPNGVDVDFFTPISEDERRDGERAFRLLFVGNLTTRKGADLLVDVMQALGPEFELHYTSGLRESATLDLENAVGLNRLDRMGVRHAMREADVFLFPTRLEGLSISVLEAMACGLPIVASDQSSMPELVDHGRTGLLCRLDPIEFADAVQRLADAPDLRKSMGVAGRERAVGCFSMKKTVERYVQLFCEIL